MLRRLRRRDREPRIHIGDPRFEGMPALLETKLDAEQVTIARDLRKKGLAARKRRKKG